MEIGEKISKYIDNYSVISEDQGLPGMVSK